MTNAVIIITVTYVKGGCCQDMFSHFAVSFFPECSPEPVGLPGGPRPKSQDSGVRVSAAHSGDFNLLAPTFPVDVNHNCPLTTVLALFTPRH